jgi:hypothetical protein
MLQQRVWRDHTTGVTREISQDAILCWCKRHFFACHCHQVLSVVNHHVSNHQRAYHALSARRELHSAQERTHAGEKFANAERFDEIIIRAKVQAANFILVLAASGHEDNGDGREGAHFLRDAQAVQSGHHDIEQRQRGRLLCDQGERLLAVTGWENLVAFYLKIVRYQPPPGWLFFSYLRLRFHLLEHMCGLFRRQACVKDRKIDLLLFRKVDLHDGIEAIKDTSQSFFFRHACVCVIQT